ncbi:MAG: hypothetical protein INR70_19225, partial [Parafilimonas terrae]|nr:hypothetical protein [Parafilimonas terrae]
RIEEGGAEIYGYRDSVVFPVDVTPADPARPVRLALRMDYAVCTDLCLPAHAEGDVLLGLGTPSAQREDVRRSLALVPVARQVGEPDALAVTGVRPAAGGVEVEARATAGATLFAEAPEPWYAAVTGSRLAADGSTVFTVSIDKAGRDAPPGPLRLTLVAGGRAIEVAAPLDGPGMTR